MSARPLTREQLEERLAALHRTSLDLIQDTSLDSLLERIAALAAGQVGARYAAVGVLNEEGELERFITFVMSAEEIARMPHPPRGRGLIGALMHGDGPIRIPDIAADPRSAGYPAPHPPMRSLLGVSIRLGDQQLGQIYLTEKQGAPEFSAEDQQVIETLAAYAAIAIANARLYADLTERDQVLTRRNENLALLNHLASLLGASPDIEPVLEQALASVMDNLHLELGEIYLRDEDSRVLRLALHHSELAERLWRQDEFRLGEGAVGQTARSGQPLVLGVEEITSDLSPSAGCFRQAACFPLTGRRGSIGVLCVANCHNEPLGEEELQLLTSIGAWVGMAVENMRLNLQQRRLAILEERERIGMDLHDGIIQSIYAVGLTLDHARLLMSENPEQARQRINQATLDLNSVIRDIRAYILDLRPRQLQNETLMQGIQRLATEFRANTLVEVDLEGPPDGLADLPDEQAIALFHICQEALANIAKHGRARRVEVALWTTPERVVLEVNDDGRGFDLTQVKFNLGHGLANMQTRARSVGGEVEITSAPGQGTSVLAWVPYLRED